MRALDLFCGAGGASMGLHQSGFEVVGVDHKPQRNYPFSFWERDSIRSLWFLGKYADGDLYPSHDFDLVWASPPCQKFTAYKRRHNHVQEYPNLIPQTRDLLEQTGKYYVIENVPGAPLENPVQLCGSSFGLDVRRHRIFEANFPIEELPCNHSWQTPRFPPATNRKNKRCTVEVGAWRIPLEVQQRAMGIDWMTREELSQAIPPAYAKHIGECLKAHVMEAEQC